MYKKPCTWYDSHPVPPVMRHTPYHCATATGFLSLCNPCFQPEARSNGPDSDVRSFSSGGWYNGDGRIAKAGWAATATSGRAEGSVPDHKVYFQFNDIFE